VGERPARPARFLKTQQLFAAVVPALVVVLSITGFVWAQKSVTVVVDGDRRQLATQATDVAGALRDARVPVDEHDLVAPSPDSVLINGETIVVRHAVNVVLDVGGRSIELAVIGNRVADALVAAGIDPADASGVAPSLSAPLEEGMRIEAPRTVVRIVEKRVTVPFRTIERSDPSLAKGKREVVVEGCDGLTLRLSRVMIADGVESEPVLVSSRVITKPVDRVVAIGISSSKTAAVLRASYARGIDDKKGEQMTVTATGYAPGSDGVDWRTATGGRAGYGVIAVDPKVIPLGTRLFVPGYGYGIASDTGGAIKGARIDLCYDTRSQALLWGRRTLSVVILD
jgi:uncharacterized protein YabE (DUF348 family)